jgi:hypothetical protein
MADMSLPFKLLSQPSPDTSGAIAADTRKLASGEALQRLKTSGLMDVQRRKGGDTLRNTAFQLGYGLTPEQAATGVYNPDQQAGLGRLQTATEIGKFAPGLAALFRAGVGPKLTKDSTVQSLPTIGLKGTSFPGAAAEQVKAETIAKTGRDKTFWAGPGGKQAGTLSKITEKEELKSKQKASGGQVQQLSSQHINAVSQKLGIPRDRIMGIVENPRNEPEGIYVAYKNEAGESKGRKLTPEDLAGLR